MPFFALLLIAIGLAMDAFAVSIPCGMSAKKRPLGRALLIGGVFGFFQGAMPLLGWILGRWTHQWLSAIDYWIAFGLLLFVGGHMILQALQPDDEAEKNIGDLSPRTLLTLGLATSIDAFAIGVSLSMIGIAILYPVLLIGAVTFILSFAGVWIGSLSRSASKAKLEITGGLILIGLGVYSLMDSLIQNGIFAADLALPLWTAFSLTLVAGLATGIGSLLALCTKRSGARRFSFLTGVSSGILLWVSLRGLLPPPPGGQGRVGMLVAFFGGMMVSSLIDQLVPSFGNPHEPLRIEDMPVRPAFRRTGMPAVLAMLAHSFPEGLALFVAVLHLPLPVALGAALALALHNIPEGIATALPMAHATGSRAKACGFSALTGLGEPLGALIAYTLLYRFLGPDGRELLCAAGGGVFVFISLDGLLPAASLYRREHHALAGVLAGLLAAALLFCL